MNTELMVKDTQLGRVWKGAGSGRPGTDKQLLTAAAAPTRHRPASGMSDEDERDRRGRFERNRSPQRNRSRSRERERERDRARSDAGAVRGGGERPAPDDPPATLFVAELPPKLQIGALEKVCVNMTVRPCPPLPSRLRLRSSSSARSLTGRLSSSDSVAVLRCAGIHEQPPAHRPQRAVGRIHRVQFWSQRR